MRDDVDAQLIRNQLIADYSHLSNLVGKEDLNVELIEETKHWLMDYPSVLKLYERAVDRYGYREFERNVLDDLRLSLETLLKLFFENNKPLEKQLSALGEYIQARGGSKEFANMFVKLLDYYAGYQNTYIKHNDAVVETELEFLVEMTSAFMKHLIRVKS